MAQPFSYAGLERIIVGEKRGRERGGCNGISPQKRSPLKHVGQGRSGFSIYWVLGRRDFCLVVPDLAWKMRSFRADISQLQEKVGREFVLKVQTVLLNVGSVHILLKYNFAEIAVGVAGSRNELRETRNRWRGGIERYLKRGCRIGAQQSYEDRIEGQADACLLGNCRTQHRVEDAISTSKHQAWVVPESEGKPHPRGEILVILVPSGRAAALRYPRWKRARIGPDSLSSGQSTPGWRHRCGES